MDKQIWSKVPKSLKGKAKSPEQLPFDEIIQFLENCHDLSEALVVSTLLFEKYVNEVVVPLAPIPDDIPYKDVSGALLVKNVWNAYQRSDREERCGTAAGLGSIIMMYTESFSSARTQEEQQTWRKNSLMAMKDILQPCFTGG